MYQTNGAALLACKAEIYAIAVYRLRLITDPNFGFESRLEDSYSAVVDGLFDPSTIFVKNEPHPSRKALDGRFRCITPVSLVDQLVESCLFAEYAEILSRNLYASGSAVGIGFTDKMNATFREFMFSQSGGFPIVMGDFPGYDALHTEQTLLASSRVDELAECGSSAWNTANRRWALISSRSVAAIGPRLYTKSVRGMINSGSKDTSRRNTLMCLLYVEYLSIISDQPILGSVANGDDHLIFGLENLEAYQKAAASCGIKLRDVNKSSTRVEFCSHAYSVSDNRVPLVTWAKGVFRLLTKAVPKEDALQFLQECRHNVEYDSIAKLIAVQSDSKL
jgi:hypothetical protein